MSADGRKSRLSITLAPSRSWWALMLTSALIVAADQTAKHAIIAFTPYGASYPITSFFNLVHVRNWGAAFSILADAGGWQRYAFIALGIGASATLTVLLYRGAANKVEALAFSLIIGGALGNVADRIALGYVVDYLDFYWRNWHWPAFNVADIAITTGAFLLVAAGWLETRVSAEDAITSKKNLEAMSPQPCAAIITDAHKSSGDRTP